jgi:hypothetical protein
MTRDLPRGFLRAEAQWLEEPDEIDEEAREAAYEEYCEHMYEVYKDDEYETNR